MVRGFNKHRISSGEGRLLRWLSPVGSISDATAPQICGFVLIKLKVSLKIR